MGMKVGELYAVADVRDKQFNTKLGRMRKMLGNKGALVGAAVAGTAAIGAAFSAVAADGIKQFSNMEKQMSEVFTLLPNASSDAKEQMIDDMQEFKMEMGTTTDETVPALYDAISAGVPEDNVFEFLETAQKAARGGVTDLNTAVDGLTTVINAYGKEVGDAEDVSDILFTTVKTGKTTMDELGSSLSDVAPIAAAVGVNFEDVGAALATMTAQGVPTAEATTQLRQAMNELSKEGTNAYDVFKDVAGVAFTEFTKNGGNLQEAMVLMEQAAEDSNTKVQNLFQNIRGGQAALTLTGSGAKTFAENLNEMQDRAGATDNAFNTMMDTSATWQERLGSAIEVVREKIGEQLQPYFQAFVKWAVKNMPDVVDAVEKIGPAIETTLDFLEPVMDGFRLFSDLVTLVVESAVDVFYQLYKIVDIVQGVTELAGQYLALGVTSWNRLVVKGMRKMFYELMQTVPKGEEIFGGIVEGLGTAQSQLIEKFVRLEGQIGNTKNNIETDMNVLDAVFKYSGENTEETIDSIITNFNDLAGASDKNTQKIVEDNKKKSKSYKDLVDQFKETNKEISNNIGGNGSSIDTSSDGGKKTIDTGSSEFTQKGTIFEGFVQESAEQGKKGGAAFARQFNGNLNAIDLMTPTEEAMQAQTDYISEMNAEQLARWIETQNKKSEIRRSKHEERVAFNKKWGQRLFEQNATEMEMLVAAKEKAIAEAEKKNAATWAIKQFYNNKIDALEAENNKKSIERFKERFGFIKTGFKNAFSSILQGTKNVTEAFGDLWNSILNKVMNKLAEMAASKVFNFIVSGGSSGFFGDISDFFGGTFHDGGVVPGPIGAERLILAQGGETVTPVGKNMSSDGGYKTANISVNLDGKTIAQAVKQPLVDSIRIKGGARY